MKRFIIISFFFISLSIFFQHDGTPNPEIEAYLPYYLSNKPLIYKIFDSRIVDLNAYQARELSYFIDYFDYKFIEFSTRSGFPHFLSISYYLFCFFIALGIYRFSLNDLELGQFTSLILVVLFWTTCSIFLSGIVFRSAKIGVSLSLVYLFILIFRLIKNKVRINKYSLILVFLLSFLMTLFDRQGFYLVFMALIFVSLWGVLKQRSALILAVPLFASLFVNCLYNFVFGPWLTYHLNGYLPNLDLQQINFSQLCKLPLDYIYNGISLFLDTVDKSLGNFSPIIAFAILVVLFIYLTIFKRDVRLSIIFSAMIALLVIMIIIMVVQHPQIIYIRETYYWLPTTILIIFAVACLSKIQKVPSHLYKWINIFLLSCIIGNCLALPQNYKNIRTSTEFSQYFSSVINALGKNETLIPEDVKLDPIYQVLKKNPLTN